MWPAYLHHAGQLAQTHHPGSTPIEDRLRSFTPVRALVFGQYGEASAADVHALVAAAASAEARRVWRRWGARTESEARSMIVASMRRRLGVFVCREFARHRLRRLPLVGVPPVPPLNAGRMEF